ncbi:hypothetical protein DERF_008590 [Dermatophagoides farinae]|uniref:Uncharacterized protein n=1 Tax=Dermatophagoides farinae TaxID=6954 RepID=A0A922I1Z1_DERFA|nr:hypothetical protein DERF_008590 [Dermatophagoides farinae]
MTVDYLYTFIRIVFTWLDSGCSSSKSNLSFHGFFFTINAMDLLPPPPPPPYLDELKLFYYHHHHHLVLHFEDDQKASEKY